MARLEINLFGSFQAVLDGTALDGFESNKVRALLAYLVVENQTAHRREKLTDLFWHQSSARRASSNLSQALYNLRQVIRDETPASAYLLRSREQVQFAPTSDYWLDVNAFLVQLETRRFDQPIFETELQQLQVTLDLYRGDFLEDLFWDSSLAFDEWVILKRQRLQRLMMAGLHAVAKEYVRRGQIAAALPLAWRQVELDPLDERAVRQLMQFLVASDQRSQALAQYERLRVMLAEELDLAPEPETAALQAKIRGELRRTPRVDQCPNNLPIFLTPLIGRKRELDALLNFLKSSDCRLLTVIGPGGSGKTRLALEAAHASQDHFQQGVFHVPLNPLQSTQAIVPAIAQVLEIPRPERGNVGKQLIDFLRNKRLLLLLDGYEHLLAGADLLADILHQVPGVKILVTSRMRLQIKGEQLYLLSGMGYPQAGDATESEILAADAVQLLLTGLQRSRPGYEPGAGDLKYLLRICQQVQGMPLGLLLAASWGGTLSPGEIAVEVSRSLDFLTADWADLPDRQRSMRATFDHTWNLINEDERQVFQRLSVFRGAFTRRAAQVISGATPYALRGLVERTLLDNPSPGWYLVHELLRQYGHEQLASRIQLKRQVCELHSQYYLEQLGLLGTGLKTGRQGVALEQIALEHENYRAAWNWAAEQAAFGSLARVLDSLGLFYEFSLRYADGESACATAAAGFVQAQANTETRLLQLRLATWRSRFVRLLGQPEQAQQLLDDAEKLLFEVGAWSESSLAARAFWWFEQGESQSHRDRTRAVKYYQDSLQAYRQLDDPWRAARTLAGLGFIAHHTGAFSDAVRSYAECLALYQRTGDPRGIANTLVDLAHNHLRQGQLDDGQWYMQDGIALLQQLGDRSGVARGYFELGRNFYWRGDFPGSCRHTQQAVEIFEELGMLDQFVFARIGLGLGCTQAGEYAAAHEHVAAGIHLAQELEARREMGLASLIQGQAFLGQGKISQAHAAALEGLKQYQAIDQRDEMNFVLVILIYTYRGLGQVEDAVHYLCETLQNGISTRGIFPILHALFAAALLLIDQGKIERALELSTLARQYPFVSQSHWIEDIAGREIAAATAVLPEEVVTAALGRGQVLEIWRTVAELLDAFQQSMHGQITASQQTDHWM